MLVKEQQFGIEKFRWRKCSPICLNSNVNETLSKIPDFNNCFFLKRKPFVHFVCFFKCCSFFLASCRNDSRYKNSSRVKESSRQTMLEKFSDLKLKTFVQHGFLFNKITKFYCCSVFFSQKMAQFFSYFKKEFTLIQKKLFDFVHSRN